jgi:hypothetical protein
MTSSALVPPHPLAPTPTREPAGASRSPSTRGIGQMPHGMLCGQARSNIGRFISLRHAAARFAGAAPARVRVHHRTGAAARSSTTCAWPGSPKSAFARTRCLEGRGHGSGAAWPEAPPGAAGRVARPGRSGLPFWVMLGCRSLKSKQ